jgi:hypothetical protein
MIQKINGILPEVEEVINHQQHPELVDLVVLVVVDQEEKVPDWLILEAAAAAAPGP